MPYFLPIINLFCSNGIILFKLSFCLYSKLIELSFNFDSTVIIFGSNYHNIVFEVLLLQLFFYFFNFSITLFTVIFYFL